MYGFYKVNVDFGMTQGPTTTITTDYSIFPFGWGDAVNQVNCEFLVYVLTLPLETDETIVVIFKFLQERPQNININDYPKHNNEVVLHINNWVG